MTDTCAELQRQLHHDIPLTQTMGLRVLAWDGVQLRLGLPLAANGNHAGSMFGGSLYSLAVLCGWGWLLLKLREAGIDDGQIVIQSAQCDYLQPVLADAEASCAAPAEADWQRFLALYRRRGLARLHLCSEVPGALRFAGDFVVQRRG